jgi:bifunctional non-homologous end joining protein LigD
VARGKFSAGEKKKQKQQNLNPLPETEKIISESGRLQPERLNDNETSRKLSHYIEPMLAKQTDQPFDNENWLFEIKWDGYRAIAERNKKDTLLYSRNGLNFKPLYPAVVEALKKIPADTVLDGEIVVLDDEGKPDFQFLQHYSENQQRPIQYCVFDLLKLKGKDVTSLPLIERKKLLQSIVPDSDIIRYSDHILEKGIDFFQVSKERNLEGIMAKKINSQYFPGARSADWLKIKHFKTEEAIIAGFTAPAGSRKYFGALILASKSGDHYIYTGHTGTGFNEKTLKEVYNLLQPLIQQTSPFREKIKTNMPVTWVKPSLICEIKYSEVTADGMFRHPVFLRLRDDKSLNEINMANIKNTIPAKKVASAPADAAKKVVKNPVKKAASKEADRVYTFGKNELTVTHPGKIYFPEEGVTKGDVVDYYVSVAKYILPYLKCRPESLLRHPNGINQQSFFQKDAADNVPSFVNSQIVHSESNDKDINYIVCDNIETLVYLNNLGCIEINPWHSTVANLDNPDYLMIDIDPSEKNTFDQVIEVALMVKAILDKAGAPAYCKTSGASGMHIYVPTGKKYTFDQVKDFAYLICMMAQHELPDFTTLERNLQKRGNKHIYMDYLQNRRGQTIASVYSLRPKAGATVSTPLLWEEVKKGLSPKEFTIHNTLERIEKVGDLFKGVLGKGIDLKKCIAKLEK